MDVSGFLTSLASSLAIYTVLLLIFAWLSRKPGNYVIYFPNRVLKGLAPPEGVQTRSPIAWIKEAWLAKTEEIIAMGGLDAAVYIIFLRSGFYILAASVVLCMPILMPLSGTDSNYEDEKAKNKDAPIFSDLDLVAMGNISPNSNRLWAFLLGLYWVSLVTYYTLWKAYKYVLQLRANELSAMRARPEQFVILVRDIPCPTQKGNYKEHVDALFRKMYPDTYEQCIVSMDLAKVTAIWTELQSMKQKLAHAEAVYAGSKTSEKPEGVRPEHKTGTLGLCGPKVDSIHFYNEKIKELTPKLEEEQRVTMSERQLSSAFVIFNNRSVAISAAQSMHGKYANEWVTSHAPEPKEVVWGNLSVSLRQRMMREPMVYGIVFLTICFYMIPIAFVSGIIALDNLRKKLPFLKVIIDMPVVKAILQAFLPQLALLVFLALLPMLLKKLSLMEGIPSLSHVDRATAGKYFYFNVFNVFLGVTIGGTLFNSLQNIIDKPKSIINLLSASLPPNATFFITFIALKFLVGYGMELSRIVPLIVYHVKRKFLCKTEEELQAAWAPGGINYATTVPADMLVLIISLCYSIISPFILIFAATYFGFGWLLIRNQVLNVKVPDYESGGRMWPHMHERVLAALFVSQITMLGYLGIKKFAFTVFIFPLPIATLIFSYVCKKFFYPSFLASPLCIASDEAKEKPPLSAIIRAYTPESLLVDQSQPFEDAEKFEDASSAFSSRAQSFIKQQV